MNNTLQTESTSQRPAVFFQSVPTRIYFDLSLILLCVLSVFGRTITSYFLADDFGEIHYLHRISTGNLDLLVANFTGNYMQIHGMSVYRPFLLLSLLFDFIIWKTNAAGFYATNLLFYFLDAALLYLIVLKLGSSNSSQRNRLTALSASVLFAVSPLHCESVSWVLGRVDIVCAFFYLLSFLLVFQSLEKKSQKLTVFAIAAFISGLLVKEMAIGIPVIAFLAGWLYQPETGGQKIQKSIRRGLTFAWPYLAATLGYFLVRFLALGTFIGGYVAGFGASQEKNALTRWLDMDTLERIAFPLVQGHFQASELISLSLLVLYLVLSAIFAIRLVAGQVPLRFFLFLAGWFITTLLPIYKLWGIGYNLEGARFLFFFTMPLAAAMAAGLFQNNKQEPDRLDRSLLMVSSAVAISLSVIFAYVASKTDLIWVNAGKEVRSAAEAARSILSSAETRPAVFLGIPKESKGTHMILNGDTFRAAVMPPFAKHLPRRKYATFEPVMYSPEYEIDATRLKSLVAEGAHVFVWSSKGRQFDKVQYTGKKPDSLSISPTPDSQGFEIGGQGGLFSRSSQGIVFKNTDGRQGIRLSQLNLNPLAADFAVVEIKTSQQNSSMGASWIGTPDEEDQLKEPIVQTYIHVKDNSKFQTVYVPLSRHWKWFQTPSIETVFLTLPHQKGLVKSIEFAQARGCCPEITVDQEVANENGLYALDNLQGLPLTIDGSTIKDAQSIILEIGKANFFFDNFKASEGADAVEKQIRLSKLAEEHHLKRSDFKGSGIFQIRARALDKDGNAIAVPSSSITVQCTGTSSRGK